MQAPSSETRPASVAELLARSARRRPDATALSWSGGTLAYGELARRVAALAANLAGLGIGRGDRVVLYLPNTPTYVMATYALFELGAVVVNLGPGSQGSELRHILDDSGAVAVISLDVFLPGLYRVLAGSPVRHLFITSIEGLEAKLPRPPGVPEPRPFAELLRPPTQPSPTQSGAVGRDDLAVLGYTSGSTGAPKGVALSHGNILASVAMTDAWMAEPETPNAGVVCVIPFFHVFGMIIGLHLGILKAYRLLLVPRFSPLELMPLIKLIESERPLSFPAVPTLWAALVGNPAVTAETLASVRVPSSGGAPLPPWVQERYRALTGRYIYEAYGLTEACGPTHCSPFVEGPRLGSIGRPLTGITARLVDPAGGDVAPGEVGELLVRGGSIMQGYYRNPELSARVLRDGWLATGDLARVDADGYYYIVDRKDDLILSSGHNVYPSEVEAVLLRHPAVADAAVVGVPDRLRGQVVKAHVVVRPGQAVTVDALCAHCRDNLSPEKVPRIVVFTDAVPRNPAGKTLRRGLP